MTRVTSRRVRGSLIVGCVSMLAGCAGWAEPPPQSDPVVLSFQSDEPFHGRTLDGFNTRAADGLPHQTSEASVDSSHAAEASTSEDHKKVAAAKAPLPPRTQEERAVDNEFEDPFAKPGEQNVEVEEYDPWEKFNVAIFNFNRKVDRYLLKPVATAYDFVVPDEVELGIRRMFYNVRFVPRMLNNLFQGKFKGAGIEMGRFLINSSLGLAGYLDFAKEVFGLETPPEDLGQTLGAYGLKPGRYLVLPIPPFVTTVRDLVGYVGDIFLDPFNYLVFPSIQLNGAPAVIDQTHRLTISLAQLGTRAGDVINERAIELESFAGLEESTIDLYGAVRNAYLQKRAQSIRE